MTFVPFLFGTEDHSFWDRASLIRSIRLDFFAPPFQARFPFLCRVLSAFSTPLAIAASSTNLANEPDHFFSLSLSRPFLRNGNAAEALKLRFNCRLRGKLRPLPKSYGESRTGWTLSSSALIGTNFFPPLTPVITFRVSGWLRSRGFRGRTEILVNRLARRYPDRQLRHLDPGRPVRLHGHRPGQ